MQHTTQHKYCVAAAITPTVQAISSTEKLPLNSPCWIPRRCSTESYHDSAHLLAYVSLAAGEATG